MKREHFVKVVEEILDSLPQEFRSRIQNVAVLGGRFAADNGGGCFWAPFMACPPASYRDVT